MKGNGEIMYIEHLVWRLHNDVLSFEAEAM